MRLMGLTIVSAGSASGAATVRSLQTRFSARVVCSGARGRLRALVSRHVRKMSFLCELAVLCPSAPRSALAWAADFLSDNGFLSVAELAGADPGDLEGWSATAAVNVQTVLSLIKAANARNYGGASQLRRRGAACTQKDCARRRAEAGAARKGARPVPAIAIPAGARGLSAVDRRGRRPG